MSETRIGAASRQDAIAIEMKVVLMGRRVVLLKPNLRSFRNLEVTKFAAHQVSDSAVRAVWMKRQFFGFGNQHHKEAPIFLHTNAPFFSDTLTGCAAVGPVHSRGIYQ